MSVKKMCLFDKIILLLEFILVFGIIFYFYNLDKRLIYSE